MKINSIKLMPPFNPSDFSVEHGLEKLLRLLQGRMDPSPSFLDQQEAQLETMSKQSENYSPTCNVRHEMSRIEIQERNPKLMSILMRLTPTVIATILSKTKWLMTKKIMTNARLLRTKEHRCIESGTLIP
jgi:hypothetical protein